MSTPKARRPHWLLLLALAATTAAAVWPADDPAATDLLPEPRATRAARATADRLAAAPRDLEPTTHSAIDVRVSIAPRILRRQIDETAGLNLFGEAAVFPPVRSMTTAPPAPPPAASEPEPPTPTPGVTARGLLRERGQALRALLETAAGDLIVLSAGQALDADWRVDAVTAEQVILLHLPTQTRQSAPLPTEP